MIDQESNRTESNAQKLINSHLKRSNRNAIVHPLDSEIYWNAIFFNLEQSTLYQELSTYEKKHVLADCSHNLLLESYFIEQTGISYSAKLTLLAPTLEEKQMFSFIASDEATHLYWLSNFITGAKPKPHGALIDLIEQVIIIDKPNVLYYLVQIILEGWGLKHYNTLSKYCQNADLKKILLDIVKDEALHHHTGKTFFDAKQLSQAERNIIKDVLTSYCDLIRSGPQAVAHVMSKRLGGLNLKQKTHLFNQLGSEAQSFEKLLILKKLMLQPGMDNIVAELENENYFKPYPDHQCAQLSVS